MKLSIHTVPVDEIEVKIHCSEIDDEVNRLHREISALYEEEKEQLPEMIPGYRDNTISLINPDSISLIYTHNKKVYIETADSEYEIKYRLYEFEKMTEGIQHNRFIRVSNTHIVNFNHVKNLDIKLNGTVIINLQDGQITNISRRYTDGVMRKLGVK